MQAMLQSSLVRMVLTCLVAGGVLAVLAPYGTHNISFPGRLAYWVGLCMAGGIGTLTVDVFEKVTTKSLNPYVRVLAQSLSASFFVLVALIIMMKLSYGVPRLHTLLNLFFYIWVVAAVITGIGALMKSRRTETGTSVPERAALYERLPPKLRSGDIYALSAEDHYVRVITSKGDDLILMRLSDAIKETAPLKGVQPHRSWWVAESGIDKVSGNKLTLHTGQTVPISRSGKKVVREAGWL